MPRFVYLKFLLKEFYTNIKINLIIKFFWIKLVVCVCVTKAKLIFTLLLVSENILKVGRDAPDQDEDVLKEERGGKNEIIIYDLNSSVI